MTVIDVCQLITHTPLDSTELGIGVTAYGVLSRGLLSSAWSADRVAAAGDMRAHSPRFQGDNLTRNLTLVEQLRPRTCCAATVRPRPP